MPTIRPISDLRNKAKEISRICHESGDPVFITKNGEGDLVVLRRRYGIAVGTTRQWIDTGVEIRLVPIPRDVIAALRGSARGENLAGKIRLAREHDRTREQR